MNHDTANSAQIQPGAREQLAQLLRARVQRAISYPLTAAQQAMWFHQNLEPQSTSYNMPFAFCLHGGNLNPGHVQRALVAVVERHPVLRTQFLQEADEVVQKVAAMPEVELPFEPLAGGAGPAWQAAVVQQSRALSEHAFDLTQGKLFRFKLLAVADNLHVLLATFHHIVMDGWSIGVFLADFAKAYLSWRDTGEAPVWPAFVLSYGDYARNKKHAATQEHGLRSLSYWRERLHQPPPALALPTDFARPSTQTFNGAIHALRLNPQLKRELTEVARESGATFFMLSLTAFYILLARLSGQWDMVLGVAAANREQVELRGMLGLFSEILPMRGTIDKQASFMTVLSAVRQQCLSDYEHAAPSLVELSEAINSTRDIRRSNLFQVGFDYQNTPWPDLGNVVSLLHGDTGATKLDLNLNLSSDPEGLLAQFEYNTDLFSAASVAQFATCFQCLLESIVRDPYLAVSALKITRTDSVAALVAAPDWSNLNVLQLIQQQAQRNPEAIALIAQQQSLSYRELQQRVNQLSAALFKRGISAGNRIGLCCERSFEMIVGILAILRAGCAYVPMDSGLPISRIDFIANDAQLKLILTSQASSAKLAELEGIEFAVISQELAGEPEFGPDLELAATDLAYLLYTSGTTGQPKGVMVTHGALSNFVIPAQHRLCLSADDKVLQFASIGFDASIEEIFPCLASGASLVLRDSGMVSSIESFIEYCNQHGVTVLDLPTAYWHTLTETLASNPALRLPASVRLVVIGGEAAAPRLLASWQAVVPQQVQLQNTYGPTETTVCVTTAELASLPVKPDSCIALPIGQANPGVSLYVLDERGAPVPPGVYGEIYIGGNTLADGYWRQAELTAQKFLTDPFSPRANAKMFRTGDYGRFQHDGQLQFGGRKDGQIKLRGYRIELSEVGALLESHPQVKQVCADIRVADEHSQRSLVAFVILQNTSSGITPQSLRRWMSERCPEYLVPSAIALVASFPTGLTGKIDRDSLHRELLQQERSDQSAQRPATPTEEIIIGIWSQVLGVEKLAIHDSFFERGGHSLLMIKMLSKVRRQLAIDVPLAQVFEHPTVAAFASYIESQSDSGKLAAMPLPRLLRSQDTPLLNAEQSFAQQRMWFHERLNPATFTYHVPIVFDVEGQLDYGVLERSLQTLMNRHEILRTSFHENHGRPVQSIATQMACDIQTIDMRGLSLDDQLHATEEKLTELIETPFQLGQGPVWRSAVLHLDEQRQILVFVFHHIVIDDWSVRLFLSELHENYLNLLAGREPVTKASALQYVDYSAWQNSAEFESLLGSQLSQWQQTLHDAPEWLNLPLDYPRPARQNHRGASYSWRINAKLAQGLRQLALAQGLTLHMLLLSAWSLLLSRLSGQDDLLVGVPVANRAHPEVENMLGLFVNTLPIRIKHRPEISLPEFLKTVRESSLSAYARQNVPFERIVEAVQPQRDLARHPLFSTIFAMQDEGPQTIHLGPLKLQTREVSFKQTKLDLSLTITQQAKEMFAEIEYASDLFEAGTIVRWAGFLNYILEQMLDQNLQSLSQIRLQDQAAEQALLRLANANSGSELCQPTLYQLFAASLSRHADAAAIQDGDQIFSYQQLADRSEQIADSLLEQGVKPGDIVGLALPRSIDMVASILAIFRLGAAYLPIDCKLPAQRIAWMLADAESRLVILENVDVIDLRAYQGKIFCLQQHVAIQAPATRLAAIPTDAKALAYVIYTSGSSGEPKGVMIEQGAAVRQIQAVSQCLELQSDDKILQFASSSFDVSVQEIFVALTVGATLVLRDQACLSSAQAFWEFCKQYAVTLADLPTRFWHELTLDSRQKIPACIRKIIIGGEMVEPAALQLWFSNHENKPRLFNFYGPTEATINATMQELLADRSSWDTVGKPFGPSQAYILDRHGALQAVGVIGQLYIAGDALARGYLKRESLSAQSFVTDTVKQAGRMYATGDLAYWRENGDIVLLGRQDKQIKLRGFRIDLNEIEQHLHRLSMVASAVAVPRDNSRGEKRIVAYVSLKTEFVATNTLSNRALVASMMAELARQLPAYMLPAGILILPELPLNQNGKVDLHALPDSEWVIPLDQFLPPETTTEIALAEIWADLLDCPLRTISLASNFFELGGHSLLSMRLAAEIRKKFAVELSVRELFGFVRLIELANQIDSLRKQKRVTHETGTIINTEMGWL